MILPRAASQCGDHIHDHRVNMIVLPQSYGIKVGYGASGTSGVNLNAANAAPAKSNPCCA